MRMIVAKDFFFFEKLSQYSISPVVTIYKQLRSWVRLPSEQIFLGFNGVCAFSGRRRSRRQRSTCDDFVNLEDLPAQSLEGAYRGRVACMYS